MSLLLLLACGSSPAPAPEHDEPSAVEAAHAAPPHSNLDAFAHAFREALADQGAACSWQHESSALRCTDGSRHDLRGLWVLVEGAPEPATRAAELLAMVGQATIPDRWEQAAPFLLLRPQVDPAGASTPLHLAHPDGLAWTLEAGLPGGTQPVSTAQLEAWGRSWEQAQQAAVAHVDAIDAEPFWPLSDQAARARVGDGHDPARLLSGHLATLSFQPTQAVLVPDQALVVGAAGATAELDAFAGRWRAEHPGQQAWHLVRDDQGWAPAATTDLSPRSAPAPR